MGLVGAADVRGCLVGLNAAVLMRTCPSALQEKGYLTADVAEKQGLTIKKLSGTKFRQMLRAGDEIPDW